MGQPIRIENINHFKGFTHLDESQHAVVRTENVSIIKKDEPFKYPNSIEESVAVARAMKNR